MCSRLINEQLGKEITLMYNNGLSIYKISEQLGGSPSKETIRKYLKNNNISKSANINNGQRESKSKTRYTDEDKRIIGSLYSADKMNELYSLYPNLTKSALYSLASRNGYRKEGFFWSQDEILYLKDNYYKLSTAELEKHYNGRHDKRAISGKAHALGLTISREWTDDENNILIENYSKLPIEDVMKLLPNRTQDAIVDHCKKLNLISFHRINERYTDEQKEFILNHWQEMSDEQIGEILGKSSSGIMAQRNKMNLYKVNKNYENYKDFSKFFRHYISTWKTNSMKQCNYCCLITHSKDYVIHHIYSFNKIVEEALYEIEKEIDLFSEIVSDYSKELIERMIEIFKEVHNRYPLGVCIRKDIHDLFHRIYGAGGNTELQWNNFIIDLYNNKYNGLISV